MNQQLINVMLALVRYEIGVGEALSEQDRAFASEHLESLYKLSKAHDMAHLASSALFKLEILGEDEISKKFSKQQMLAMYRCERISYEMLQISNVLEEAEIAFMPLKGAWIRPLYPEPWMRTSCDIDVLVRDEDLNRAIKTLKEKLAYTSKDIRTYHDVSLFSPSGVHLELHFSIKENMDTIDPLLSEVWDYAVSVDGTGYQFRQTDEYLLFHHVAHMSHHFVSGGCGMKPFLDLYLMRQKMQFDSEKLQALFSACDLQTFYDTVVALTDVWFNGASHNELTQSVQAYIIEGGVYGKLENGISAKQGKRGGKLRYAWSRIFLSKKTLENYYPRIRKHVWLVPFCQVHRWIQIVTDGRFKRSVNELKMNSSISKEQSNEMKHFLDRIGL